MNGAPLPGAELARHLVIAQLPLPSPHRAGRRRIRVPLPTAGEMESFGFESYLGAPREKEFEMRATLHEQMEARMGMGLGGAATQRRPF